MNLYFRLLWLLLVVRFRPRVQTLGPCITSFRCWPSDLDVLLHMNNGKYFSILDLARVDLMARAGFYQQIKKHHYYPVVTMETMRFYKSLQAFNRFEVETTVLGWDDKTFYLQQRFLIKKTIYAEAIVHARFLKKSGGSVSSTELIKMIDPNIIPPILPNWLPKWDKT